MALNFLKVVIGLILLMPAIVSVVVYKRVKCVAPLLRIDDYSRVHPDEADESHERNDF